MKASEYDKLSLLEKVKVHIEKCRFDVEAEPIDPGILSDIGTEGVVLDKYVVYIAKGEYDFDSITGKRTLPGYLVWKEVPIPATRHSPPDSDIVDILTTQRAEEAIQTALKVVLEERCGSFADNLADSQAAEAEEEYEKLLQQSSNGNGKLP